MIELFNKLAYKRNYNSQPVFRKNDGNNKLNKLDISNNIKHTIKSEKLKSQKLVKS